MKGIIIRARMQWIEDGEKPTKYFLNLEKRNYVSKLITCVRNDNGNDMKDDYQNLYDDRDGSLEKENFNNLFKDSDYNIKKLTTDQSNELEGDITYLEALNALKRMRPDKSPGPDGFTAEFFKFFWCDIGHFWLRSINFAMKCGQLSVTQKQGSITLLPKGNKPRCYIQNWRPITLLNISYKLASMCIAEGIQINLPQLITSEQKGFIAGRYIGESIRDVYDIMLYADQKNIPGLLLLIDFEKAFDTVSFSFLRKVLQFYKFGSNIIQ
jgi:hypothetical protein